MRNHELLTHQVAHIPHQIKYCVHYAQTRPSWTEVVANNVSHDQHFAGAHNTDAYHKKV